MASAAPSSTRTARAACRVPDGALFATVTVCDPQPAGTVATQPAAWPSTAGVPPSPRRETSTGVQESAVPLLLMPGGVGGLGSVELPAHSASSFMFVGGANAAVVRLIVVPLVCVTTAGGLEIGRAHV